MYPDAQKAIINLIILYYSMAGSVVNVSFPFYFYFLNK